MAPAWLQPLLWIYCRCERVPDYLGGCGWSGDLIQWGFIVHDDDRSGSGYKITPKARVFIDAVLAVPHPVAKWVIQVGTSPEPLSPAVKSP